MATDTGIKISSASEKTSLAGTEMLPLDDSTNTAKMVKMSTVSDYVHKATIDDIKSVMQTVYASIGYPTNYSSDDHDTDINDLLLDILSMDGIESTKVDTTMLNLVIGLIKHTVNAEEEISYHDFDNDGYVQGQDDGVKAKLRGCLNYIEAICELAENATTERAGLMPAEDKAKLDAKKIISHIEGVYVTQDDTYIYLNLVSATNYKFADSFPLAVVLSNATTTKTTEISVYPTSGVVIVSKSMLTASLSDWDCAEIYGKIIESRPLHFMYADTDEGIYSVSPEISVNRWFDTRKFTVIPEYGYEFKQIQIMKHGDDTVLNVKTEKSMVQSDYDMDLLFEAEAETKHTITIENGIATSSSGKISSGYGRTLTINGEGDYDGYSGYVLDIAFTGTGNIRIEKSDGSEETRSGNTLSNFVLGNYDYTFTLVKA